MLNNIPKPMLARMKFLEEIDQRDRTDGTSRLKRLRQIPPETGQFLALLASMAPEGRTIEIGTSAGYSTLWLALACRAVNRRITTFEILEDKAKLAAETFELSGVNDVVELVQGDALQHLQSVDTISFCFLDAEKEVYSDLYDLIIPKMVKGGIFIADNAIDHAATLQPMLDKALHDPRLDSMIVQIGKGELVCRKI